MNNRFSKRLASAACAFAVFLTSVRSAALMLHAAADEKAAYSVSDETELMYQSIELYPNGDSSEQSITLEGMMPEGAEADAVDVSEAHEGIAAYDITITAGNGDEFQPVDDEPIAVEINDPSIHEGSEQELWHIRDDGEREQIYDFTAEEGKIRFLANGFSIYKIVELSDISGNTSSGWTLMKSLDDLIKYSQDSRPLYIAVNRNDSSNESKLLSSKIELESLKTGKDKRIFGIKKTSEKYNFAEGESYEANKALTDTNPAAGYYLIDAELIDVPDISNKKGVKCIFAVDTAEGIRYVKHPEENMDEISTASQKENSLILTENKADATYFVIYQRSSNNPQSFHVRTLEKTTYYYGGNGNSSYIYWNTYNGDNGSVVGFWNAADERVRFWTYNTIEYDPNELDGKSYGIFHYINGATRGNALMAEGDTHSLIKLLLTAGGNDKVLYVDENNEIDRWTFAYDQADEKYTVTNGSQYLAADSSGVFVTNAPENASRFELQLGADRRVKLKSGGYYITYNAAEKSFGVTSDEDDEGTWLWLLDRADLENNDLITFSADRVSISDVQNGQKVIVYLRIWNEQDLRYDIYAVDHNGSLYPCYAQGGKIMWLGDGTGSLEWEFTEYTDEVTKEPNYYYELYNPYSEKYIAPQLAETQVLSEDKIGINIPGRRNGDFFSEIIAWDNSRYAYIGLRPNADKTALEPCSKSASLPFYFATLEELNLAERLHEVPTIDNDDYGIKMKMVNFDPVKGMSYGDKNAADVTSNFLSGSSTDMLVTGMLGNKLKDNGYPDIAGPSDNDNKGKDLADAYSNAIDVNHLFLERVHNSSGYFEFDSSQNFATLKKTNPDGTVELNTDENNLTNFTLYRELGTHNRSTVPALKHGQFFPYDTIKAGVYSKSNPLNMYTAFTDINNNASVGLLPESDPRKYEKLHLIQTEAAKEADYYFGMEMEAKFVQTPSGLDSWGHDIIFEFAGDDDFWLYVDDELVLDLGGTHAAVMGKVNFRTGEVIFDKHGSKNHNGSSLQTSNLRELFMQNYKMRNPDSTDADVAAYLKEKGFADGENIFKDYSNHTMKIFYMERGGNASNLSMRFNLAAVTPGHVVLSKSVSGDGADVLDNDFIEYPFQIYYTLPEGENGEPGEWHLLSNDDEYIGVSYQNSNQPVTFVRKYRPPGVSEENAYNNIYFINPKKNAEISFPDNTITYKIVECAVDSTIYGNVTINGSEVPPDRVVINGDLRNYSSETVSAEILPTISFDNKVNDNVIKDLFITKKLLDENDQEITDDPATFSFRLNISSVDMDVDSIPPANMYKYYIISPNLKMCRYDLEKKGFVETELVYSREAVKALSAYSNSDPQDDDIVAQYNEKNTVKIEEYNIVSDDITFTTSGFGAISGIPSGYTICVPGLPVGSLFKVTEDIKTGYGLVGYERVMGTKINEDHSVESIPSYYDYEGNPLNIGRVIAEENPQLIVKNKKGYGLGVNKKRSDLSLTKSHESIYTAVYVDGELLDGSVRQIRSPATSAYYFWTSLKPYADGAERTDLSGYTVREVTLSGGSPTVDADGTVSNYGTVTPLDNGDSISLTASRTAAATPEGESSDKEFNYIVSYQQGQDEGSTRNDTISNTREGGIALRLFKWESDTLLQGGVFTLKDGSGNTVGTYTSGADGIITMLYSFEYNSLYTLSQTTAPKGYVGMQKAVKFKVNDDDTVSMLYQDGTSLWGQADIRDLKWANSKSGNNGIIAYVNVYNKPFNFKIMKTDGNESFIMLDGAHFALYKQANTTISGLVKNKEPMSGFEDMVTVDGIVDVCGGNSGRVINPGVNGSVYFLTEINSPFGYKKLSDDIIFRISPIGVPLLISDSYNGRLVETEECYIYTLSVPNVKEETDMELLTIDKKVNGAFGDKTKDFTFTIQIEGAGDGDKIIWAKNGEKQPGMERTGGKFTMKHNDRVEIALPPDVSITLSENNEGYSTSFKLNDEPAEITNKLNFMFTGTTVLFVTNTLDGEVATGLSSTFGRAAAMIILSAIPVGFILYYKRKKKKTA